MNTARLNLTELISGQLEAREQPSRAQWNFCLSLV